MCPVCDNLNLQRFSFEINTTKNTRTISRGQNDRSFREKKKRTLSSKRRRIFGFYRGDHNGAKFRGVNAEESKYKRKSFFFRGTLFLFCFEMCYQIQEEFVFRHFTFTGFRFDLLLSLAMIISPLHCQEIPDVQCPHLSSTCLS